VEADDWVDYWVPGGIGAGIGAGNGAGIGAGIDGGNDGGIAGLAHRDETFMNGKKAHQIETMRRNDASDIGGGNCRGLWG